MTKYQARYWKPQSPESIRYTAFQNELTPSFDKADTLEGELLRAASNIYHECFNNGFGNNVSGELRFIRYKSACLTSEEYELLLPYSRGRQLWRDGDVVYPILDRMLDRVLAEVEARNGIYRENLDDCKDMAMSEISWERPAYDDDDLLDGEEDMQNAPGLRI